LPSNSEDVGRTPSCINKQVSKESSDERSNEPPEQGRPPAQAGQ
jgi:hypothetical protein